MKGFAAAIMIASQPCAWALLKDRALRLAILL